MQTTVTGRNMVTIPQALADRYGIRPGWKLDWAPGCESDELVVKLVPDRRARGRRLLGAGKSLPGRERAIDELIAEREHEE